MALVKAYLHTCTYCNTDTVTQIIITNRPPAYLASTCAPRYKNSIAKQFRQHSSVNSYMVELYLSIKSVCTLYLATI